MDNKFSLPGAIIVAGVLIAGSIIITRAPVQVKGVGGGTDQPGAGDPGTPSLVTIAKDVQLDLSDFTQCVKSGRHAGRIQADVDDAVKAGGSGTPYTVVVAPNDEVLPLSGALAYETIQPVVDSLLGTGSATPPPSAKLTYRSVDPAGDHLRGSASAPVTFIEYSDTECPFCKRFHVTMRRLVGEYDGKVRWVYRHFPLDSLHPKARKEAEATECAGEQGKFWEYLDRLFEVTPSNNGLELGI